MNTANARFAAQWPWAVVDPDGHVINRFKTEADARAWADGWQGHRVRNIPTVAPVDIF